LINTCKRALCFKIYNYKIIQNILENNLDFIDFEQEAEQELPDYSNSKRETIIITKLNLENMNESTVTKMKQMKLYDMYNAFITVIKAEKQAATYSISLY